MHEMIIIKTPLGHRFDCKCGWKNQSENDKSGCLSHIRDASQLRGRLDKFPK